MIKVLSVHTSMNEHSLYLLTIYSICTFWNKQKIFFSINYVITNLVNNLSLWYYWSGIQGDDNFVLQKRFEVTWLLWNFTISIIVLFDHSVYWTTFR